MGDQVEDTVEDEIEDIDENEETLDGEEDQDDDVNDGTDDDDDEGDETSEYEEVEIDGAKYQLPKKLKDNLLMQSDYTRKTQEVAESRRSFQAEVEAHQNEQQLYQQHQEKYAELHALNAQIKQYEQVDWNQLQMQDPALAQQHQFNFVNLKNDAQQKANDLEGLKKQAAEQQQGHSAKRKAEVVSRLSREVEGWSGERAKAVAETAQKMGFTPQFLKAVNDAVFPDTVSMVKALNKAALYDEMVAKSKKVGKSNKEVVKVTPTRKVGGGKANKKSIYDPKLTTDQRIKLFSKK